jgi:hypothetical protein
MTTLILACAPIVAVWIVSSGAAWIRTPARRGALARRLRSLIGPPSGGEADGVVDLSRRAAAYLVGIRVGSFVRGISYLILIGCVVSRAGPVTAVLALLAAIWLYNRWRGVAGLAYSALTGSGHTAFGESALKYQFPSHRRGRVWNLGESTPATVLSATGLALILAAGLPLAFNSDTLISPVPGLYVRHSSLPPWALALAVLVPGAALTLAGARLDRAVKRRAMRRETTLPERGDRRPTVVFLRPFGIEQLRVVAHQGPRRDGIALLLPRRDEFLEDVVTWLMWSRGEVVAIADPRVGSPQTVGAARHPVSPDRDWTETAAAALKVATAIVLVSGSTPGISWEYEQIRKSPPLSRKTLVVNPDPVTSSSRFLTLVGASSDQADNLRERDLVALAATCGATGPKLLASALAEDIDYEMAVDGFLRNELPQPSRLRAAARLVTQLTGLARRTGS